MTTLQSGGNGACNSSVELGSAPLISGPMFKLGWPVVEAEATLPAAAVLLVLPMVSVMHPAIADLAGVGGQTSSAHLFRAQFQQSRTPRTRYPTPPLQTHTPNPFPVALHADTNALGLGRHVVQLKKLHHVVLACLIGAGSKEID